MGQLEVFWGIWLEELLESLVVIVR